MLIPVVVVVKEGGVIRFKEFDIFLLKATSIGKLQSMPVDHALIVRFSLRYKERYIISAKLDCSNENIENPI